MGMHASDLSDATVTHFAPGADPAAVRELASAYEHLLRDVGEPRYTRLVSEGRWSREQRASIALVSRLPALGRIEALRALDGFRASARRIAERVGLDDRGHELVQALEIALRG